MEVLSCTAFRGTSAIASGPLEEVARKVKRIIDGGDRNHRNEPILVFDDATSEIVEIDFRGTLKEVLRRLGEARGAMSPEQAPNQEKDVERGPGRPKLGVVSREVSLLPRHWDWLNAQPGGASAALRRLVEEARRVNRDRDKVRRSREITFRFMSALAGDMPGFEEAIRALFAGNLERFATMIDPWPLDIQNHIRRISAASFPE